MNNDKTTVLEPIKTREERIDDMVFDVVSTMNSVGYNAIDQLAGYIMSEDPTYITAKEGCRIKIIEFDRLEILDRILKKYIDTLTKENTTRNKEES